MFKLFESTEDAQFLLCVYSRHQTGPEDARKETQTVHDYIGWVQLLVRNPMQCFTHLPLTERNYSAASWSEGAGL